RGALGPLPRGAGRPARTPAARRGGARRQRSLAGVGDGGRQRGCGGARARPLPRDGRALLGAARRAARDPRSRPSRRERRARGRDGLPRAGRAHRVDRLLQQRRTGARPGRARALGVRLAKYLAHAGVASRRAAEAMIVAGRVRVAGEVVRDPAFDVAAGAAVALDGRALEGPEARVAYAVHKPPGVVSTARDTHGRPTVVELVPGADVRLFPVGRLDADSSGLILLTNDGALAQRLTHPSFEVPRTYRVTVGGPPVGARALRALCEGVTLEDGLTAP